MKEYLKITNEDNLELMARYPDNHFDLAIVDPPYGIETKGNAQDRFSMGMQLETVNDNKPSKEYFEELFRVSKNQIIWGYNHLSDMLPKSREFIFWYKHQPVITFADGELAWTSFSRTAKCFDFSFNKAIQSNKGQKIHPTQKPKELYQWIFSNYANENEKILDTHLGSGSIAIALDSVNKIEKMNLTLTACELDTDYYKSATERIEEQTKWNSLF